MMCQHCQDAIMTYKETSFEAEAQQGQNPRRPNHLIVFIFENYECESCGTQLQTKTQQTYELKTETRLRLKL